MTYEQAKDWWQEKDNKNKVVLAASFLVIFLVGFGTGKYEKAIRRDANKAQGYYTTPQAQKPADTAPKTDGGVAGTSTSNSLKDCPIKGNIGSGGKKIYHIKGGSFYDRTNAEQCFNTEAEAVASGYVKSSR